MADCYITQLPDHILCLIFSFLTLKDAARTRSLTSRWRYLHDTRCVLQFDDFNVFGKEITNLNTSYTTAYQSKFVEIVDHFLLKLWRGDIISKLIIHFDLGNKHALHINRWIATAVKKGVEEIDLDLTHTLQPSSGREIYAFAASRLLEDSEKNSSCLMGLCLKNCHILPSLSPSLCERSWLSRLFTLELCSVPLCESDVECILSTGGLHLTTLNLLQCDLPLTFCIDGQLVCLKKLVIEGQLEEIKLNCPNLKEFEFWGLAKRVTFAHVPKLRKTAVLILSQTRDCSLIFDELTRKAPQLEALSLYLRTEVQPLLADITRARLRMLDLRALVPCGFDILTITHILNATPFLEIFHLEFAVRCDTVMSPRREYPNGRHGHLKEIKISSSFRHSPDYMELALYLMRNAVVLEQMVLGFRDRHLDLQLIENMTNTIARNKFNPRTQVIIQQLETVTRRLVFRI